MKILLSTNNTHKVEELKKLLPQTSGAGVSLEYLSFADFPQIPEPQETGLTLKENAVIKALAGLKATGLISLADDTGLLVDALDGEPGVYSARYAGPHADYAANNKKLLSELQTVPPEKRTARFCTVAALALPDGQIITEEGIVEGFIGNDYLGSNGFGYDPLFIVKELNKTMAQLSMEQKNLISHRSKAFKKIALSLLNIK